MYSNTVKGQLLSCQRRAVWNVELSWWCCPWCSTLSVSLHTVVILGWAVSIYSCSRAVEEGAPAPHDIAVSLCSGAAELLYDFHWAKTMSRQRQAFVRISVTSATSICHLAVHPPLPPHPGYLLTLNALAAKRDCGQGLLMTWSVDVILSSTLIPSHVPLNYTTGANPMHSSLCNMCSCLWCSSAICRENPVIAIQYFSTKPSIPRSSLVKDP